MKRWLPALTIAVVTAFNALAGGGSDEAIAQTTAQDKSVTVANVTVSWLVEEDSLTVTMSAPTTGWVAVGFDPSRMMKDADMVIGYVSGGTVSVRDDFGTTTTRHVADTANGGKDDVFDASGTEVNGVTSITFSIPLDSGDPNDTKKIPGSKHKLIVAYGPNNADDFGTRHRERGSIEITL